MDEPLLDRTVRALLTVGLDPDVDADLENVTFTADRQTTVGVVMNSVPAVVFYAVWPDSVPEESLGGLSEYTTRANSNLYTSAFELDLDRRILSVRSAVATQPLDDLDDLAFGRVLATALEDALGTLLEHHEALVAILDPA